jgi:hypothetical protein
LPTLSPSDYLIELDEHRLRPIHPITRQPAHSESEQQPSAIAVGAATYARSAHDCWNRECHRNNQ